MASSPNLVRISFKAASIECCFASLSVPAAPTSFGALATFFLNTGMDRWLGYVNHPLFRYAPAETIGRGEGQYRPPVGEGEGRLEAAPLVRQEGVAIEGEGHGQ